MQALAVICPLVITATDRTWIEDLRAQHDPLHDLVEAHFTLVFPITGVGLATMATHVDQIAKRTPSVGFRLSRAQGVRDSLAPRSHVFLVPDVGDAEIRALHSMLYAGDLASSLRADIPYQPHVTVAAFETQSAAEGLARDLGEFQIEGRLQALALVSVGKAEIRREGVFPLI
jgi:2'-5' RNA ligase